MNEHHSMIGGPGRTVEIDEAKFGKKKYNRGRIVEGQWVLGGYVERQRKLSLFRLRTKLKKASAFDKIACCVGNKNTDSWFFKLPEPS